MEDWQGLCWILTSKKIVIFVQIYDGAVVSTGEQAYVS